MTTPSAEALAIERRFWSKVQRGSPDECWMWTATVNRKGYGAFRIGNRMVMATHVVWQLQHGERVPPGQCVLHFCDNPGCCNPLHLWTGTKAENNWDAIAKGRKAVFPGESNGQARLTANEVREIVSLCHTLSQRAVARRFGVCDKTIRLILAGKTWAHLHLVGA
jgi:hypothetical protein